MRILERYIVGKVLLHTAIVLMVLLGIYFFITIVGEINRVGRGDYTLMAAAGYSAMLVPRQIHELFPMAALVGTMLGLGSLANTCELTVMRAAGLSIRRIAFTVMKAGLLMVVLVSLNSEFVAPAMEKQAHFNRMEATEQGISFRTGSGLWVRDGDSYITMGALLPDGEARELTRYLTEGHRVRRISTAHSGRFGEEGWRVTGLTHTDFMAEGVSVTNTDSALWRTSLTPDIIASASLSADRLSVLELMGFIVYLRENGLASERYEVAMWTRMFLPLATGGMILLAIPFVFGSNRGRGTEQRVLLGVLVGIGFYLFNGVFSQLGLLYHLPPLISAVVPTVVVYSLSLYLMRRILL